MSAGKLPYIPLYVDDFLADTMGLSAPTLGVWTKCLLCLWKYEPSPGRRTQTLLQWSRQLGFPLEVVRAALNELVEAEVGQIVMDEDKITISSRRLIESAEAARVKSEKARASIRSRWDKSQKATTPRASSGDTNVLHGANYQPEPEPEPEPEEGIATPSSLAVFIPAEEVSTGSPIEPPCTLEQCLSVCESAGVTKEIAQAWWENRAGKDWHNVGRQGWHYNMKRFAATYQQNEAERQARFGRPQTTTGQSVKRPSLKQAEPAGWRAAYRELHGGEPPLNWSDLSVYQQQAVEDELKHQIPTAA